MLNRLTAAFVLTFAIPCVAAAQAAQGYPPATYQQQGPYPQQYPPQQVPPQPMQPVPQYPYPQPGAADPGYGYPPGAFGLAEPLVSSVRGLLQLSLGTYFVRYTANSQSFDNDGGDFSVSGLNWGFSGAAPVFLEGGYGLTDNFVIGGVLQLGGSSLTNEAEMGGAKAEESGFDLMIAPKVDYQFMPTSKINPFVGGLLGVEINSTSQTPFGATAATDDSQTSFTLLARGGLRCYLFDGFSVDPALSIGFRIGGGSVSANGGPDADYSVSGFRVGLSVSMSGWLRM